MSELYRKLDCSRYDGYCHGCPAEHLPEGVECQINAMRDEQAKRDVVLGRAVREAVRATCASDMAESEIAVDIRSYARLLDGMPNPALWAALILRAIADALEQEAANAATGH